jgi:hypothetical protein
MPQTTIQTPTQYSKPRLSYAAAAKWPITYFQKEKHIVFTNKWIVKWLKLIPFDRFLHPVWRMCYVNNKLKWWQRRRSCFLIRKKNTKVVFFCKYRTGCRPMV